MPERKDETEDTNENNKSELILNKEPEKEKLKENIIIENNESSEIIDLTNSIHYINSENIQNIIYTPQKLLSIFDDLMKNFRLYIPNFISSGPQLVSSRYATEYYVYYYFKLAKYQ